MKKLALLTVIATLGLLKLHADLSSWDGGWDGDGEGGFGLPSGLTSVDIDLVALGQGSSNTNTNNGTITVHFKQSRIDNNKILGLINTEFGTSFSETNGDRLAVSNFWDGKFIVLGRDGTVLLANASSNTNGDHFQFGFSSANTVFSSIERTNCETKLSVTDGFLTYESGNGSNSFQLEGFTTVNDSYYNNFSNSMESFQLTGGVGSISLSNPSNSLSGVLTGSASGSGRNNAPAQ